MKKLCKEMNSRNSKTMAAMEEVKQTNESSMAQIIERNAELTECQGSLIIANADLLTAKESTKQLFGKYQILKDKNASDISSRSTLESELRQLTIVFEECDQEKKSLFQELEQNNLELQDTKLEIESLGKVKFQFDKAMENLDVITIQYEKAMENSCVISLQYEKGIENLDAVTLQHKKEVEVWVAEKVVLENQLKEQHDLLVNKMGEIESLTAIKDRTMVDMKDLESDFSNSKIEIIELKSSMFALAEEVKACQLKEDFFVKSGQAKITGTYLGKLDLENEIAVLIESKRNTIAEISLVKSKALGHLQMQIKELGNVHNLEILQHQEVVREIKEQVKMLNAKLESTMDEKMQSVENCEILKLKILEHQIEEKEHMKKMNGNIEALIVDKTQLKETGKFLQDELNNSLRSLNENKLAFKNSQYQSDEKNNFLQEKLQQSSNHLKIIKVENLALIEKNNFKESLIALIEAEKVRLITKHQTNLSTAVTQNDTQSEIIKTLKLELNMISESAQRKDKVIADFVSKFEKSVDHLELKMDWLCARYAESRIQNKKQTVEIEKHQEMIILQTRMIDFVCSFFNIEFDDPMLLDYPLLNRWQAKLCSLNATLIKQKDMTFENGKYELSLQKIEFLKKLLDGQSNYISDLELSLRNIDEPTIFVAPNRIESHANMKAKPQAPAQVSNSALSANDGTMVDMRFSTSSRIPEILTKSPLAADDAPSIISVSHVSNSDQVNGSIWKKVVKKLTGTKLPGPENELLSVLAFKEQTTVGKWRSALEQVEGNQSELREKKVKLQRVSKKYETLLLNYKASAEENERMRGILQVYETIKSQIEEKDKDFFAIDIIISRLEKFLGCAMILDNPNWETRCARLEERVELKCSILEKKVSQLQEHLVRISARHSAVLRDYDHALDQKW